MLASSPVTWRLGAVRDLIEETPHARTIVLDVSDWPGHIAGQHMDIRLTAEDGYQTERSYSIASPPEQSTIELTVERIDDGDVSPYLTEELRVGDELELRGPFGGYFNWRHEDGCPLLLIAGASGLVPPMAMLRHRAAISSAVDADCWCRPARSRMFCIATSSGSWARETGWSCTTPSPAISRRTGAAPRGASMQRC